MYIEWQDNKWGILSSVTMLIIFTSILPYSLKRYGVGIFLLIFVLFTIPSAITLFCTLDPVIVAYLVSVHGAKRLGLVVQYEDDYDFKDEEGNYGLILDVFYLHPNNKDMTIERLRAGMIPERCFPYGTTVVFKEYKGHVLLVSEHGDERVPENLKLASDAYYLVNGDWNP
jgi:hypothetical protein